MQTTIRDIIPKSTLNLLMKRGIMKQRHANSEEAAPNEKKLHAKNCTICGRHSSCVFTIIRSSCKINGLSLHVKMNKTGKVQYV